MRRWRFWRLLNKGQGLCLGHAKPAEHPRLVLKGSHSNITGTLDGWPILHLRRTCIQRCTATRNNKPGSHLDYAHQEVLYHPSYPERSSTSRHIDSMWSWSFQQGCASQCVADGLLILQYLNLVTNQEKEFSESRIRVKWQRRDAKLQSRDSANHVSG